MSNLIHTNHLIKKIATIVIFSGFGFLLFKYREDFYILQDLSLFQFISLSLLIIVGITLSGSKLNRIVKTFNIYLKKSEWFALSSMTTVLNSIFFKSGSLATSTYLKKKYAFPYASFVGSFIGDQLIILFIASFIGSITTISLIYSGNVQVFFIFIIFVLITVFLFFLLGGKITLPKKEGRIWEQLRIGTDSFNTLLQNKNLFYTLCSHNIFLIITAGLRLFTACSILNQEIPLTHCFLFVAGVSLVKVLPIAHSDIGLREIIVGFLSQAVGSGLKAGVLITSIDRIFELFLTGLSVGIFRKSLVTPKS
jgi:hypothetical protein